MFQKPVPFIQPFRHSLPEKQSLNFQTCPHYSFHILILFHFFSSFYILLVHEDAVSVSAVFVSAHRVTAGVTM